MLKHRHIVWASARRIAKAANQTVQGYQRDEVEEETDFTALNQRFYLRFLRLEPQLFPRVLQSRHPTEGNGGEIPAAPLICAGTLPQRAALSS